MPILTLDEVVPLPLPKIPARKFPSPSVSMPDMPISMNICFNDFFHIGKFYTEFI